MKKVLILILFVIFAPFLMLIPLIGAVSAAVGGFYDHDSGEDFDPEKFKRSEIVQEVSAWYQEYIDEYAVTLNERKAAVEKENTTVEKILQPKADKQSYEPDTSKYIAMFGVSKKLQIIIDKSDKPDMPDVDIDRRPDAGNSSKPDEDSDKSEEETGEEEETEEEPKDEYEEIEIEVCHVNVTITMDNFPLSAVLSYYNVLFYNGLLSGGSLKTPTKADIKSMLAKMTDCTEGYASNGSDYYIVMSFRPYAELPEVIFPEWSLSEENRTEYEEMYLNVTEMVSGWLDENLGLLEEENVDG